MSVVEAGNKGAQVIYSEHERLEKTLPRVLIALALLTLLLWFYLCYDTDNGSLAVGVVIASLLLGWVWLERSRVFLAVWSLVLASAVAAIALAAFGAMPLALPAALATALAACLIGPGAGFVCAMALVGSGLLVPGVVLRLEDGFGILAFGLVLWAGLRSWQDILSLLNAQAAEGQALIRQLREEQGGLNRTLKALDTAYALLESSNRALELARREAEELRALKQRFAASLSHELRTPLNIIIGFSELIYRRPSLYGFAQWPEALRRDLAQIQRNAGYLSSLLDDVLDLARLDVNAMPVRRELGDLRAVVEQSVGDIAGLALEKMVQLRVECDEDLPLVYIDEVRIRQVLFNLLSNAIRVSPPGGIVAISLQRREEEVLLSVHDQGPGIPPEAHRFIFDEYRQLDGPCALQGKGLGLAIAKHFVLLHGGRIWVESDLGKGTTFCLTLPLHPRSFSRLSTSKPLPPPKARLKPLLVTVGAPEEAVSFFRRRLEEFAVTAIGSAAELAGRWQELQPAGVLCLHENALEAGRTCACAQTESLPGKVPVICCTLPQPWAEFQAQGFTSVLRKPVSEAALRTALEDADVWREGVRLLIADDDRGFVQLLCRMLEATELKPQLLTVYNGIEALRIARQDRPEAILLDLFMPGLGGLEVLQALKEDKNLAAIPVIAVTAADSPKEKKESAVHSFCVNAPGPWPEDYLFGLLRAALSSAFTPELESAGHG